MNNLQTPGTMRLDTVRSEREIEREKDREREIDADGSFAQLRRVQLVSFSVFSPSYICPLNVTDEVSFLHVTEVDYVT